MSKVITDECVGEKGDDPPEKSDLPIKPAPLINPVFTIKELDSTLNMNSSKTGNDTSLNESYNSCSSESSTDLDTVVLAELIDRGIQKMLGVFIPVAVNSPEEILDNIKSGEAQPPTPRELNSLRKEDICGRVHLLMNEFYTLIPTVKSMLACNNSRVLQRNLYQAQKEILDLQNELIEERKSNLESVKEKVKEVIREEMTIAREGEECVQDELETEKSFASMARQLAGMPALKPVVKTPVSVVENVNKAALNNSSLCDPSKTVAIKGIRDYLL